MACGSDDQPDQCYLALPSHASTMAPDDINTDVAMTDATKGDAGVQHDAVTDIRSLTLVTELEGHSDRAWGLAWNPTMPLLASCSSDKQVRLHSFVLPSAGDDNSVAAGSEDFVKLPRFRLQETIATGHRRTVRSVAWAPTGRTLATASFDSTVGIWERVQDVMSAVKASGGDISDLMRNDENGTYDHAAEWDCIGTLEGHDNECKGVAFSHDGGLLASCSRDKSVWVWEVQDQAEFDCLSVLMEHSQDVKCVAWHPREELLASASYDDTIKLYIDDPSEDWFAYATLTGHTSTIWSLSFSPCGIYLASGSEDQTVRIWRRLTPEQAEQRGLKVQGKLDGTRKGDRWTCVRILKGWHTRSIYSVSWGHADRAAPKSSLGRLATAGADGSICVFDVNSGTDEDVSDGKGQSTSKAGVDALAPQVTLAARVWEAHGDADVNCVCWAPSTLRPPTERTLRDEARIRELSTSDLAREEAVNASQIYPLGNLLASSADDGTLRVWQF